MSLAQTGPQPLWRFQMRSWERSERRSPQMSLLSRLELGLGLSCFGVVVMGLGLDERRTVVSAVGFNIDDFDPGADFLSR